MSSTTEGMRGDYADRWADIKNIKFLIHAAADYIVFIDTDNDLDWETTPQYDKAGPKNLSKHNAILNDAELLETTPCSGLELNTKLDFKRLIGQALCRSFEHDYVCATKMMENASRFILTRNQETSRYWYLTSSFVMTAPFIIVGLALWLGRNAAGQALGLDMLWLIFSAIAGAMGALLSVIARTGKLRFDCSSGRKLHYLEGTSRIWAGALSGIVVALALRSEMFLAPLARGQKLHSVMMIAAFAAGAVERLATSIISTVGSGHANLATNKHTDSEDSHGSD